MEEGIIYVAERQSDIVYAGLTTQVLQARSNQHRFAAVNPDNDYPFARAIRKHGFASFVFRRVCAAPVAALSVIEVAAIDWFKPRYNATTGGERWLPSSEVTAKKRAWWTPERRAARSEQYRSRGHRPPDVTGIRRNAATRAKIADWRRGRRGDEQFRVFHNPNQMGLL